MTGLRVALLGLAVVGVVVRPRGLPVWAAPVAASIVAVLTGAIPLDTVGDSLEPFAAPLAFLVLAVPLASLLDEIGFFDAAAAKVGRTGHLAVGLWVLGAAVTTVLNLDASVLLLTPLYVRIARRTGHDAEAFAFQPVLLALVASSALPVSNLTNLLAVHRLDLDAVDVLVHLGPASLVATVVGYLAWRRRFGAGVADHPGDADAVGTAPTDRRAWRVGAPVVAGLLLSFTVGDRLGVPAWAVVAVADAVLVAVTRQVPWRRVPVGTAVLAASLGLLAAAAAPAFQLERLIGTGEPGPLRIVALVLAAAVGANLLNNLPALLAALPALAAGSTAAVWPVLWGVNAGPSVVITGALATLLWLESAKQVDVVVSPGRFARIGATVGLPALAAGTLVLVLASLA